MVLVRAGPDEAQRPAVGARALLHEPSDLHLVHGLGYAGERLDAQRRRDLIKQLLDARNADGGEHRRDIGRGMGNERHQSPSACNNFW